MDIRHFFSKKRKRDDAAPSQIVVLETPALLKEEIQTTGVEVEGSMLLTPNSNETSENSIQHVNTSPVPKDVNPQGCPYCIGSTNNYLLYWEEL